MAAIVIAIAMSVWRAREEKQSETYGSARWATDKEIRKAGLLKQDGVVIGSHKNRYLRHNGTEHILCFSPTRSGKGVGLVIPYLLRSEVLRGGKACGSTSYTRASQSS